MIVLQNITLTEEVSTQGPHQLCGNILWGGDVSEHALHQKLVLALHIRGVLTLCLHRHCKAAKGLDSTFSQQTWHRGRLMTIGANPLKFCQV